MSEQIAASRDGTACSFLAAMNDDDDSGGNFLFQRYPLSLRGHSSNVLMSLKEEVCYLYITGW